MRVKAIKKKLFKKYRENLKLIAERCTEDFKQHLLSREIVLCPICLQPFEQWQIKKPDDGSNFLSLEHVPPKYLGWTAETLTCHNCNNGSSKKDENLQYLSANPDKRRRIVTVKNQGIELKAILTVNFQTNLLEFMFNDREVGTLDKLIAAAKETNGFKFDYVDDTIDSGGNLLKIAYLLAFNKFGYGLIFHPGYNVIRQHILNPKEHVITNFGSVQITPSPDGPEDGVFLVKEPKQLASILVRYTLRCMVKKQLREETYTFHLPSPLADVTEFYKVLNDVDKGTKYLVAAFNDEIDYWHDRKHILAGVEEVDKYRLSRPISHP